MNMEARIREELNIIDNLVEARKWEDLNQNCLSKIFRRVGIESLVWDVPLVCKSRYLASLNPQSWKVLKFKANTFRICRRGVASIVVCPLSFPRLLKFAINSSQGMATEVVFPNEFLLHFKDSLLLISQGCPALKSLTLPDFINIGIKGDKLLYLPQLINKWKNLEHLDMGHCLAFEEVLAEIKTHCKEFIGLGCVLDFGELETIATLLPNIKHLSLKGAYISSEDLLFILSKFTELELLDITKCVVMDGDDKISKISSRFNSIKVPISSMWLKN